MKFLNTLLLSALLTFVAVPVTFAECPCNKNVSNEAFLKSVGKNPNYQGTKAFRGGYQVVY